MIEHLGIAIAVILIAVAAWYCGRIVNKGLSHRIPDKDHEGRF